MLFFTCLPLFICQESTSASLPAAPLPSGLLLCIPSRGTSNPNHALIIYTPPSPTKTMPSLSQAVGSLRPSLAERLRMDVARDMLALAGRTSDSAFEADAPQFSSIPSVPFRLPDGTEVRACV